MAKSAPESRSTAWRSRDILRAAAIVFALWIFLRLLFATYEVVFIGFLGTLFGITAARGVDYLERVRIPRGLGAVLVVFGALGLVGGLGWLTAPQIGEQLRELKTQVPKAIDQVEAWVQKRGGGITELLQPQGGESSDKPGAATKEKADSGKIDLRQGLSQQVSGATGAFFAAFSSTLSALGGIVLILFVTIFIAADPGLYHSGLMHLFPHRHRAKAGEVLSGLATTLRRWLATQLVSMVIIGVVTTVVLLLLGIKAAFALGLIAGLLEFIPYVGPILSAVPAVGMALADSPDKAIWVLVAYTAIQQLEGAALQPLLMQKGLELPPVLTLLGQAAMSLVFGFIGLLVAVPLLGAIMVPIKMLYVRDVVGDEVTVPGVDEEDG